MKKLPLALALITTLPACGIFGPEVQMVDVDVRGTVTLDGAPVGSTPLLTLQYFGCGSGGSKCGLDVTWYFVAETQTGADGTYRLRGQVPEDYCAYGGSGLGFTNVWLGSELLSPLRYSSYGLRLNACGENVLDFVFSCAVDLPDNAPECDPAPAIRQR